MNQGNSRAWPRYLPPDSSEVIVRDLGSRNGTFVHGKPLSGQQCQVKSGQIIAFGVLEARLEISASEPEDDNASGYFDLSKYRAEQHNLQQRQRKSAADWPLVKAHPDRTIELHAPSTSERPEDPGPFKLRPKHHHLVYAAVIVLLFACCKLVVLAALTTG